MADGRRRTPQPTRSERCAARRALRAALALAALALLAVAAGCGEEDAPPAPPPVATAVESPSPVPAATATPSPIPTPADVASAAVPTASAAGSPGPTPTPRPRAYEIVHRLGPCDQWSGFHRHFLHWARDSSLLVFDVDDTIWTLELDDVLLRQIADVDHNYNPLYSSGGVELLFGFYADVSPDGSRIVYSTCEYLNPGSLRDLPDSHGER